MVGDATDAMDGLTEKSRVNLGQLFILNEENIIYIFAFIFLRNINGAQLWLSYSQSSANVTRFPMIPS